MAHCSMDGFPVPALAAACRPFACSWKLVACSCHTCPLCHLPQIDWRLSDEPITPETDADHLDPEFRANTRTRIFLGYTSNLVGNKEGW